MARNGDGLYRRGDVWHFKYVGPDGRYHEKSTGKRFFSEARSVRDDELKLIRDGQLPTDRADWTLDQALEEALEYRQATLSRTTAPPERSAAKRLKAVLGASRRLKSLAGVDLRRYQAQRRKSVGPKTVNNEMLLLISILKQAKLWKRLEEDYKPLPVPKKGPGVALTVEQTNTLIATASQKPAWFVAMTATLLAYATGCRSWEIKSLRLQDIVLDGPAPMIRIRRENTKSNAGAREVALNEYAQWALRQLMERAALLGALQPHHFLLPANLSKHTKKTDPLRSQTGYDPTRHQTSWSSAWERLRKAAGLPNFRFHDLRHTCITQGALAGVPVEVMSAQVGHMSTEMTRYYTHIATGAKHAAVQKIAGENPGLANVLAATVEKSIRNRQKPEKAPKPEELDKAS